MPDCRDARRKQRLRLVCVQITSGWGQEPTPWVSAETGGCVAPGVAPGVGVLGEDGLVSILVPPGGSGPQTPRPK